MATSTTSAHAQAPAEVLTPSMRDRQARGKDPYSEEVSMSNGHADDGYVWDQGHRVRKHHETWEQKERTSFATKVLGNPDLLLWHAQAKGDSVTAQRLRFTAMLCGYDDYYETRQQDHQQQQHSGPEAGVRVASASGAGAGPSSASGAGQ